MRSIAAFILLPVLCLAVGHTSSSSAPDRRPNIVVILVDDMGFSDIGCYGSEIATPNLDRLAGEGLRYTQFYNTARCCPTRASLLTGLYAHQAGVGHMVADDNLPGYRGRLNDQCITIAEALRPAGYFTAMSGKWHIGQNHGVVPSNRGFDRSLNAPAGGFYYADNPRAELYLDGKKLALDDSFLPKDWYTTDLWTDTGIRFIEEAGKLGKPFFLYLAHNAPHFPIQADEADVARFRGKYRAGWDALREARIKRQRDLGLIRKSWALSPRPDAVKAWDSLTEGQRDRFDQIMAIAAASIHAMDRSVGRLVEHLRMSGSLDNTLILFMSDNGGNAESGPAGKLEPPGQQQHTVAWTGESWAGLENTPFRRYKHFVHEGGISSPLIAHWPNGIRARGRWRTEVAHVIDIMPTCLEVAGAAYPAEFKGRHLTPLEGRSLVPSFAGKRGQDRAIFWEHEGHRAVREGKWKLVASKGRPWELYDLEADRTELRDLADSAPEKAKALAIMWEEWARRAQVLPGPRPPASTGLSSAG